MDTIFAVSSGRPPAAIAVIRISGSAAMSTVATMASGLPAPRRASLRTIRDSAGQVLDRALVIVFPGPETATGEDMVELHCHGGRATIAAVESALMAGGLRLAAPGEFTRRALMHGRIDLAEAEGLADLLEAETERQRKAAFSAADGRVSQLIGSWLDHIAILSAEIEAILDFSDEGEIADDDDHVASIAVRMVMMADDIDRVLAAPPIERVRDGIAVVLAGPPNSGKSTLLNLLAERDAAIVSSISGTTRDRIDVPVSRAGIAYVLSDTAGLTGTDDEIEAIGVERARAAIQAAVILVWLGDDDVPRVDAIALHSRADVADRRKIPTGRLAVAQNDLDSIDQLWNAIATRADELLPTVDQMPLRNHQRLACATAASSLREAGSDPLIVGECLRQARSSLASILGLDATEVMLDTLFGRFCIGK